MTKIFIGIPSLGRIRSELSFNLFKWSASKKYQIQIHHENGRVPVSSAQNKIVREFLDSDADYLLLLEADVIPPPNRICPSDALDLTEFEVDVVDGLCFVCARGMPFLGKAAAASKFKDEECLSLSTEELLPPRLIKVDFSGAGCLMIKRNVVETLKGPFFKFEFNEFGDETVVTQDYYFSRKARDAGFEVYIHSGFQCIHEVEVGI